MSATELKQYLSRIGFWGTPKADLDTLKKLLQLHPAAIPFENLAVFTGKVPSLQPGDIFGKLVQEKRGGYCYEQNLLLKSVLDTIGFQTAMFLARVVWKKEIDSCSPRTHALLIVELDGIEYLADTGFGSVTLTAPLILKNTAAQQATIRQYRLEQVDREYRLLFWKEVWLPVYKFRLQETHLIDLDIANWYLSTYPGSGFVNNLMVSKVDESASYSLSNTTYTVRFKDGRKQTALLKSGQALLRILSMIFHIELDSASDEELILNKLFSQKNGARHEDAFHR